MSWIYRRTYAGPNRRSEGFTVRFVERRRDDDPGTRASLQSNVRQIMAQGLKWIDALKYFGPDRRTGAFSFFFLERRRKNAAGNPPPLPTALRQLRVRVLGAEDAASRQLLRERMTATAMLADAQGRRAIGDLLMELVRDLESTPDSVDPRPTLHAALNRAEAMLAE